MVKILVCLLTLSSLSFPSPNSLSPSPVSPASQSRVLEEYQDEADGASKSGSSGAAQGVFTLVLVAIMAAVAYFLFMAGWVSILAGVYEK